MDGGFEAVMAGSSARSDQKSTSPHQHYTLVCYKSVVAPSHLPQFSVKFMVMPNMANKYTWGVVYT